jgi:hypothetical protein
MSSLCKNGVKSQEIGRLLENDKSVEKLADSDESETEDIDKSSDSDFCDQDYVLLAESGDRDGN